VPNIKIWVLFCSHGFMVKLPVQMSHAKGIPLVSALIH
jgi:hypothetical protein